MLRGLVLRPRLGLLIAFCAGALLVTGFAPVGWWWVAWPSAGLLLLLQVNASPKRALVLGFAYGLGLYLFGVSWVYVSLHVYGGMPFWMGSIVVLAFTSLMALFIALPCFLAAWLLQRLSSANNGYRLILLVGLWTIFEWSKSWMLTGFPWLDIGYTQTQSSLFSFAPVGGVYLISFLVLTSSAAIVHVFLSRAQNFSRCILAFALILILSSIPLAKVNWTSPVGDSLQVGVVQPNTDISSKWQTQTRDQVIRNLIKVSNRLATNSAQPAELLVWPETALALYARQTNEQFWQNLIPSETSLITGILNAPDDDASYNAAMLVCGGQQQLYRKRHLVPFGEYLPLRFLFSWVLDYLQIPMSDFSAWKGEQTLSCGDQLIIGLSICYEDAFAGEHRRFNRDATILVNISEDAWFGESLAPHQRLQMAQMRARELAKPMVRSANTGPSAIIDQRGRVVAQTTQFEAASLNLPVQPYQGFTPFQRYGNWIIWLSMLMVITTGLAARRQRTSSR